MALLKQDIKYFDVITFQHEATKDHLTLLGRAVGSSGYDVNCLSHASDAACWSSFCSLLLFIGACRKQRGQKQRY